MGWLKQHGPGYNFLFSGRRFFIPPRTVYSTQFHTFSIHTHTVLLQSARHQSSCSFTHQDKLHLAVQPLIHQLQNEASGAVQGIKPSRPLRDGFPQVVFSGTHDMTTEHLQMTTRTACAQNDLREAESDRQTRQETPHARTPCD